MAAPSRTVPAARLLPREKRPCRVVIWPSAVSEEARRTLPNKSHVRSRVANVGLSPPPILNCALHIILCSPGQSLTGAFPRNPPRALVYPYREASTVQNKQAGMSHVPFRDARLPVQTPSQVCRLHFNHAAVKCWECTGENKRHKKEPHAVLMFPFLKFTAHGSANFLEVRKIPKSSC